MIRKHLRLSVSGALTPPLSLLSFPKTLFGGNPGVTVMQTAENGIRNERSMRLDGARIGRIFRQGQMRAVVVGVGDMGARQDRRFASG